MLIVYEFVQIDNGKKRESVRNIKIRNDQSLKGQNSKCTTNFYKCILFTSHSDFMKRKHVICRAHLKLFTKVEPKFRHF